MNIIIKLKKYTSRLIMAMALLIVTSYPSLAQNVIKDFEVEGNMRIERSTILSYIDLREGDPFTKDLLDNALKNLFATGLFTDVHISQNNNTAVIKVVEKPIVNQVIFEGNNAVKSDNLSKEITLKPRHVVNRNDIQDAVNRIKEIYRMSGRFAVTVNPQMVELEQNRVNIIFEIEEGEATLISRINFIGNREYSNAQLSKIIRSREAAWYQFWTSDDKYDPDRMAYDQELLRKFYLENGYVDFKIETAIAELYSNTNRFFITYDIYEGDRYKIGDVTISTTIPDLNVDELKDTITLKKGKWYDINEVDNTISKMTTKLGNMQFAFIKINSGVKRDRENKVVNIELVVNEGLRTFIGDINVAGNTRTLDEVVRREMLLIEGDPYNEDKLNNSTRNIRNLGYFSNVDVQTKKNDDPNKTDVEVTVVEQSTGSMSIGAGYSTTEGALADFKISESNFLGKGQRVAFSTTLATERSEFDFSFTEPYFMNRNVSAGFDIRHLTQDLQEESSYDSKIKGGTIRIGYPLSEKWRQNVSYTLEEENIYNVKSSASNYIKQQAGLTTTSMVSQTTWYESRDSIQFPTEGAFFSFNANLAGLGGSSHYYSARLLGRYFYPLYKKDVILNLLGETGYINGWNGEDVNISKRFSLGGDRLRGFKDYGVGPRDSATDDSLGGNMFYRGSVEVSFPTGLPEELGIRGHVFSDFGSLWSVDEKDISIFDSSNIRATLGLGVAWTSPFGPIKINYAKPIVKEEFDKLQSFRLSFGTNM